MEGRWRGDGGEMEGRWRGDGGEMEVVNLCRRGVQRRSSACGLYSEGAARKHPASSQIGHVLSSSEPDTHQMWQIPSIAIRSKATKKCEGAKTAYLRARRWPECSGIGA